jgi:(hydroxyamino)benzene mutase
MVTISTRTMGSALIVLGAALFTGGLLTGLLIPAVTNPRIGLSAHLEGIANGTFLLALGAVWDRLRLSPSAERAAFWLLAYGTTSHCAFVFLASVFGASRAMPIASAGFTAAPWQDLLVTGGLVSVGLSMVLGMVLATWGFVQGRREIARASATPLLQG